ncbi:gamma carbonic anhydrase family protein [Sporosarcina aquimarina]|uniref:gamma carbonic anhydrase n=1 Tax=Sporosarcina aquimarina TaxID=114975 RepID=UPI00203DDE05|nr:gamma carbonic anhydrase family protein [Sporosarcina aquimarina]MCM3757684.1 gamma carbonic anhydrase family protein [Sporosarcina aquimarina]
MIVPYKDVWPDIDETVFVADFAVISGDVTIGADSSVWFSTVIRGDVAPTRIGKRVSIQDLSCLHQSPNNPLVIEDDVTIGHKVTLHSCTIKKGALVGMGSIILDGAVVGEGAFVGAGSIVPPGKVIPPGMLALGSPAKVVREVTEEDRADMKRIVESYVEKGQHYKQLQD